MSVLASYLKSYFTVWKNCGKLWCQGFCNLARNNVSDIKKKKKEFAAIWYMMLNHCASLCYTSCVTSCNKGNTKQHIIPVCRENDYFLEYNLYLCIWRQWSLHCPASFVKSGPHLFSILSPPWNPFLFKNSHVLLLFAYRDTEPIFSRPDFIKSEVNWDDGMGRGSGWWQNI